MKALIKRILFGKNKDYYTIKAGIAKGLRLKANLENKTYLLLGIYEAEIQSYYKKYAQCCNVLVDIGAADAYYSLVYRKYNKEGNIIMCDAGSLKFKDLQIENFNLNNFDTTNVKQRFRPIGIGDPEKTLTLDFVCSGIEKQNVLFKIDVDGGELDVLKSGIETFKNNNCVFVIETHSYKLEEDCIKLLQGLGYTTKIIYNGWYRCIFKDERPIEMNRWFIASKPEK